MLPRSRVSAVCLLSVSDWYPRNGVRVLAFFVDDHTERGAGGREYGTSEKDKRTFTG
jgi:hypothetical protein